MIEMPEIPAVFTIGHSTHEFDHFAGLLKQHRINAVADVRSTPYSRWRPQFNREKLAEALKAQGITYVFLGKELGARSNDPACYENGRVKYRRLAGAKLFRSGIQRVLDGSQRLNIALMCSEREPLDCHRTILVARELVSSGNKEVIHIHASGKLEAHGAAMQRLCGRLGLTEQNSFWSPDELQDQAYAAQEEQIAYVDESRTGQAQEAQR